MSNIFDLLLSDKVVFEAMLASDPMSCMRRIERTEEFKKVLAYLTEHPTEIAAFTSWLDATTGEQSAAQVAGVTILSKFPENILALNALQYIIGLEGESLHRHHSWPVVVAKKLEHERTRQKNAFVLLSGRRGEEHPKFEGVFETWSKAWCAMSCRDMILGFANKCEANTTRFEHSDGRYVTIQEVELQ